jgi:hypothetical protein
MNRLIQIVLLSWLASSCGGSGEAPPAKPENRAIPNPPLQKNENCPSGTLLTYRNFAEGFFMNYCNSCHSRDLPEGSRSGAPKDANFDHPDGVTEWASKIFLVAAKAEASMPPSKNVPAAERGRLAEWINCGAAVEDDRITGVSD